MIYIFHYIGRKQLIFFLLIIWNMMKKSDSSICITLPSLYPNKQIKDHFDGQKKQSKAQLPNAENDALMVSALEQWNGKDNRSLRGSKIVTVFKSSNSLQNDIRKISVQAAQVMEARLYLVRYEEQLRKVQQFDYLSIFKNIEYCSGMYENVYNLILKTLQKHHKVISLIHSQLYSNVQKQRMSHILCMERSINNESYREKIPAVRQLIENKENQLQPLKDIIESLNHARTKVLKHCLNLGYDVREEGLIWILRELGTIPKMEEFPTFLREKQIQFIISRFQRQKKCKQKQKQALQSTLSALCNKSVNEVRNYLTHHRKRELSIINQGQIMKQLQRSYLDDYMHENHKYLTEDILQLAQKQKHKSKATKYEIIYRQTSKKLNRFCVNQIYKKSNYHQKSKGIQNRRESINTTKMISLVESKIAGYLKDKNSNEMQVDQGERELDEIIRNLRYESYQQPSRSERRSRNVVTIVCCLVGVKRARKIIEQEMNYVF